MRKIRRTYNKLNSMAFVANARPEQSDTHSCSLNKGIGCKSRTRKESLISGSAAYDIMRIAKDEGRIPKVAVFLKYCFPCRGISACGENRSLEGLSWLGEKAEAMRLCEGKCLLHMNGSVRRPTNPETKNWQHSDSFLSAYLSIPLRSQEIQDTKAMVMTIIVFLIHKILFILTGRCRAGDAARRNKRQHRYKRGK